MKKKKALSVKELQDILDTVTESLTEPGKKVEVAFLISEIDADGEIIDERIICNPKA